MSTDRKRKRVDALLVERVGGHGFEPSIRYQWDVQCAADAGASAAASYSPRRAARLHSARCKQRASALLGTLARLAVPRSPVAGCWIARANENASAHGMRRLEACRFIGVEPRIEASLADWPPERNAMPGTAAGTVRMKQLTVAVGDRLRRCSDRRRLRRAAPCSASAACLRAERLAPAARRTRRAAHRSVTASAAGERVVAVHQHLGLDDGNDAGLLAQAPRSAPARARSTAMQPRSSASSAPIRDDAAPLREARAHRCVFGEPLAQSVKAFGDLFRRRARRAASRRHRP